MINKELVRDRLILMNDYLTQLEILSHLTRFTSSSFSILLIANSALSILSIDVQKIIGSR